MWEGYGVEFPTRDDACQSFANLLMHRRHVWEFFAASETMYCVGVCEQVAGDGEGFPAEGG